MKKYLSVLAALALLFACTEETVDPNGGKETPGGDKTVHVTGVSLDRTSVNIKEGESVTLVATVKPDNADNKTVSWSSSDAGVASVDNGGKVTGVKAGSATVTAKTEDGEKTASCVVTVEANLAPSVTGGADHISAVSAILAGKANLGPTVAADLKVGFQYSISSGILPSNSTTVEATDADASYNYTAAITGLEPETTYYYRSFVRQNGQDTYGETKEFKTKEISSIIRTQEASAISAINAQLNADLDLTDVKCSSSSFGFYWGTSDESLYYKVTATKGDGAFSADLLALNPSKQYYFQAFASFDGKEIKEAVKSFTTKDIETLLETKDASGIEATAATLNAKLDLTDVKYSKVYYGFYWWKYESSQLSYLSGNTLTDHSFTAFLSNLSPKTQYRYKMYVTLDNQTFYGEVKTFTTDVIKVESVSLDMDEYTFNAIGSTLWLRATVLPADATDKSVEWSSSNADVVTVEQNGKVTAIGNGKARITVTTKDQGKTASCVITVSQYVTGISFDKPSLSLGEGGEYTLIPTITPSNAANQTLSWTSSNESVATVDQSGKVTAVSSGSATIKAEAQDGSGKYASCSLIVIVPEAIDLGLSVKWALFNIGASKPQEYGEYFAWGETAPKDKYLWSTYEFGNSSSGPFSKYNTVESYGTVDNKAVLDPEDDAAHAMCGGKWRMPTYAEWTELRDNCTWTWTNSYNGTGVAGRIVTSNKAGYTDKSIFLPATGHRGGIDGTDLFGAGSEGEYWSSSLDTNFPQYAREVDFTYSKVSMAYGFRYSGYSIRPVTD